MPAARIALNSTSTIHETSVVLSELTTLYLNSAQSTVTESPTHSTIPTHAQRARRRAQEEDPAREQNDPGERDQWRTSCCALLGPLRERPLDVVEARGIPREAHEREREHEPQSRCR